MGILLCSAQDKTYGMQWDTHRQKLYENLLDALREKNTKEALWLIENGAPVGTRKDLQVITAQHGFLTFDKVPLFEALSSHNFIAAKALLEKGASANAADHRNVTLLMKACTQGNVEAVKLLIAHKAGIRVKSQEGESPLIFAARYGQHSGRQEVKENRVAILKLLLDAGAEPDEDFINYVSHDRQLQNDTRIADVIQKKSAQLAPGRGPAPVVMTPAVPAPTAPALEEQRPWRQDLYDAMERAIPQAIATGNTDEVKRLIEQGAPVGTQQDLLHGITFRYALVELIRGYENNEKLRSVIEILLRHGATPNERNHPSLKEALKKEFPDPKLVELLVRHGADVNEKNYLLDMGIQYAWAAAPYQKSLLEQLLSLWRPSQPSAQQRNILEIMKFLASAGTDPFEQNGLGRSFANYYVKKYPELQEIVDLYFKKRAEDFEKIRKARADLRKTHDDYEKAKAITKETLGETRLQKSSEDIGNIIGAYMEPEDWLEE